MCGIVGAYHFDRQYAVAERDLRAMADRIVHRGPDDHGYHVHANAGIGMRRLSIIDLAGGHQPIFTPDGQCAIVFNGELYNYREQAGQLTARDYPLRTSSDTEVVLGLYATQGRDFVERLNGMFGFAIVDAREDRLTIVRDRLGIKPLYYYRDDDKLVFASEIKALLAYPGVTPELDHDMLPVFFRYGFVPAPRTLFRRIYKLPPGHRLEVTAGRVSIDEWWTLSYAHKDVRSERETLDELDALLGDAVRLQMIADVPLGAFLSGGLDSSGIVHLMGQQGVERIKTYSIGFGADFSMHDESADAARFAADYHTEHHAILATPDVAGLIPRLVRALDEPLADSSFVVTYLVSELAAQTVKVILSGVGGDEIFSGYRRYLFASLDRYTMKLPAVVRTSLLPRLASLLPADRGSRVLNMLRLAKRYLEQVGDDPLARYAHYVSVLNDDLAARYLGHGGEVEDPLAAVMARCDASDVLDRVMHFDLRGSLPEQLLMLTDKMTMAQSIEARVPYLDHRLVELMARTPATMRLKGFELRHLQREYLRERIPAYVLERRKRGFGAPFGGWVRGDLEPLMRDYLAPERLRRQGLFDVDIAQSALDDHLARREDYSDFLLANLSFQIWHDEYIRPSA
ncbi:MAG: asparagine synthase (glutamine-hydrolyzing) [Gammaproteobacteria bacterium]